MSRYVMTRAQMRAYDARAIEACRVPGLVLMENAGRSAADIIERLLGSARATGAAVIVCGSGNNGGDGLVVARHLVARAKAVKVFLLADKSRMQGDARANLDALAGTGTPVETIRGDLAELRAALAIAPLCVDAIFGTGLARPLEGEALEVVAAMEGACCPCVALDIPSGIDADSGAVLGAAVRAAVTVTFGQYKTGLMQGAGLDHAGEVRCVGLGFSDDAVVAAVGYQAELIDGGVVARVLGVRPKSGHKYQAGSVLIVAGSQGRIGAALLCATAALRTGAGLATIATWPEAADRIDGRQLEVMTVRLERGRLAASIAEATQKRAAIGVGPGLGLDADARRVVDAVVLDWDGAVVVDADAISHFAGRAGDLLRAPGPRVLTPHSAELGRLLGSTANAIDADRFGAARTAAEKSGAVVVLKGPHTIVAHPDGRRLICDAAEPLLATAGSGDVLTGMVTALCAHARTLDTVFDAAAAAVWLHARAAESWRGKRGADGADRGMLAGDLLDAIPRALRACAARR